MLWRLLACRYYHSKLDAFVDGRLSPRARRRLARHMDHCPACYRAYTRRRDLQQDLRQTVPLVGRDHAPDFDRIWGAVRTELPQPRRPQFRYGVAVLLLLLALLVPFTMGNHELTRVIPEHPVPHAEPSTETPERTDEPQMMATVAASSTMASSLAQETAPPTLPEPDGNQ